MRNNIIEQYYSGGFKKVQNYQEFFFISQIKEEELSSFCEKLKMKYTGSLVLENGDIHYTGEIMDGKPHGKGTCVWRNGRIYEGEFVNGERNGYGKLKKADGVVDEGYFVNNRLEGTGKRIWPNGKFLKGMFKAGNATDQVEIGYQIKLSDGSIVETKTKENGRKLFLSGAGVETTIFLVHMKELETLCIPKNKIRNITSICKLKKLKYLDISDNKITNLTGIGQLKELIYLSVMRNEVTNVDEICNLKKLKILKLDLERIEDITVLTKFENLTKLEINGRNVGTLYRLGQLLSMSSVSLTDEQWAKFCLKYAQLGDPNAIYKYAYKCMAGEGIPQNIPEAIFWYEKGIFAGHFNHTVSSYVVDEWKSWKGEKLYNYGKGFIINALKAATVKNADVIYWLGFFYANGVDVPLDYEKAIKAFELAAELNYIEAMHQLSWCHYSGMWNLPKDREKGLMWLRKAAELGDEKAKKKLQKIEKTPRIIEWIAWL